MSKLCPRQELKPGVGHGWEWAWDPHLMWSQGQSMFGRSQLSFNRESSFSGKFSLKSLSLSLSPSLSLSLSSPYNPAISLSSSVAIWPRLPLRSLQGSVFSQLGILLASGPLTPWSGLSQCLQVCLLEEHPAPPNSFVFQPFFPVSHLPTKPRSQLKTGLLKFIVFPPLHKFWELTFSMVDSTAPPPPSPLFLDS